MFFVHRKRKDMYARVGCPNLFCGFNTIGMAHVYIHQHDIRKFMSQEIQDLISILRLANDGYIRLPFHYTP